MTESRAPSFGLWLLPLVSACGGPDPAADGTVTATLPRIEAAAPGPASSAVAGKAEAAAPTPASTYTSLDPAACKLIEENIEEGGYSRRLCRGSAGYRLETSESDLRQNMVVIAPDGRRSELNLSGLVAKGAFNSLGKAAEWRGGEAGRPKALIFRLNVAGDADAKRPEVSNLVVARLAPSTCITAIISPGPGQNDKARAVAEGKLPDCMGQ